jgi:hypothetical protein
MQVITIADAITANTNTDIELPPKAYDMHPEMFIQVEISGTFSVQVLGKLHESASYVELVAAASANYIQPVVYMPFIRITTSGGASTPVCSAYVMIGRSTRV